MTSNQLAYWRDQETHRSNVAKEHETRRSDLVNEAEKRRSNLAGEELRAAELLETATNRKWKSDQWVGDKLVDLAKIAVGKGGLAGLFG